MTAVNDIEFVGHILDNVHGFINYTKDEEEIMNLKLFKRLQSIKQLSLVNWVFPGAEHTRYIHSLGVMHIADKMAISLNLDVNQRKIVRLAGLLHDIGHYPLSHLCESAYTENMECPKEEVFFKNITTSVQNKINKSVLSPQMEFMIPHNDYHHERIGEKIIMNSSEIKEIINRSCGKGAISIICDMIVGRVDRNPKISLLVQLLHSEIDADGIDYILRDAVFAGTSFGSFEADQLINSLCSCKTGKYNILCITSKGIAAADQFLLNKHFSYSQIIFNKHTTILEWMAVQVVDYLKFNGVYFPKKSVLDKSWLTDTAFTEYIKFTDNFFWKTIYDIVNSDTGKLAPSHIILLCKLLLEHREIEFVEGTEVKIITKNSDSYIKEMSCNKNNFKKNIASVFNCRLITNHVPLADFDLAIKLKVNEEEVDDQDAKNLHLRRLMDSTCVSINKKPRALCDDNRSLMHQLHGVKIAVCRNYKFPT